MQSLAEQEMAVASPDYVQPYGMPEQPGHLKNHQGLISINDYWLLNGDQA